MTEKPPEETSREIMKRIYAMSQEEFSRFMYEHFMRMCNQMPEDEE